MIRLSSSKMGTAIVLLVFCAVVLSCSGSKSRVASPAVAPKISGPWEFIATSSDGAVTGIEVALAEGQVLVGGVEQPDGQISASSTQIAFVSLANVSQNLNATGFGGNCAATLTPTNSLGPSTVTAMGAPLNFVFSEGGNVFNVTGTLSGDGQSLLNGVYSPQSGSACSDPGGTITGTVVSKVSGTFAGQMCPLGKACQSSQDFTDNATATVSENSSGVLTLTLVLTGTDNTTFTMTGPVTANAFSVQGQFQGQSLTFYGYSEQVYNSSLLSNVPSLYLVNATNAAQPVYVGTLSVPEN